MLGFKPGRLVTAVASSVLVLAFLAGCGGGGGSSSSSGSSEPSSGTSPQQAKVQAEVAELTKRPTSIGITEPVKGGPPPGKTIVYLQCGLPDCVSIGDNVRAAAGLVGWKVDTVETGLTPQTIQAGWNEALRREPDAILQSGSPEASIYKEQLDEALEKKIPILGIVENKQGPPFLLSTGSFPGYVKGMVQDDAKYIASKISSGKVYVIELPGIAIVKKQTEAFEEELAKDCPACEPEEMAIPPTSIGTDAPAKIADFIQGHPGGKFLYSPSPDLVVGLAAALSGAGIEEIPTVMVNLNEGSHELLQEGAGGLQATVTLPSVEGPYRMIDALARYWRGQSVAPDRDDTLPRWIVEAGKVPDEQPLPQVKDYKAQFEKLWGLSN
jgi:ribose transport system substrate-binding protein